MMKGYIQVYTGNGKGKTTAAIGLTVRALGAGLKVYLAQFLKYEASSEIKFLAGLSALTGLKPQLVIEQYGKPRAPGPVFDAEDKLLIETGWKKVKQLVQADNFDLVILDEINIVLYYQLLPLTEILNLLAQKPQRLELVLTGRYAPQAVLAAADLVT
jgi:cob(I)alamin adenosyltransferase